MLNDLLPELFPIVAAQLPGYLQPYSLLSLALTNHAICEIVIPHILYNQVVLEGESRVFQVLKRLQHSSKAPRNDGALPLSHYVHRLCISSDLSAEARDSGISIITTLGDAIREGAFPNLKSLAIHLREGWYYDAKFVPVNGFGRLSETFWTALEEHCPRLTEISLSGFEEHCPRLTEISLSGFEDDEKQPWFENSGIFTVKNLTAFHFAFQCGFEADEEFDSCQALLRILNNLSSNSPSLTSLSLQYRPKYSEEDYSFTENGGLFTQTFPFLQSLTLRHFAIQNVAVVMEFWSRHPNLEQVELNEPDSRCFESPSPGLLPKLRAPFEDLLEILPIVGSQLINLTVTSSLNAQIPYLLCSVLPNGLGSLRSLGISQSPTKKSQEIATQGARWDQDEAGHVVERSKNKAARRIDANYILMLSSVVPDLEELELRCTEWGEVPVEPIASALSSFSKLKRLHLTAPFFWEREEDKKAAQACASLESITRKDTWNYTCTHIRRQQGEISLSYKPGCGRVVGLDADALPGVFDC